MTPASPTCCPKCRLPALTMLSDVFQCGSQMMPVPGGGPRVLAQSDNCRENEIAELTRSLAAAKADNARLLMLWREFYASRIGGNIEFGTIELPLAVVSALDAALKKPHPGQDLLAERERLTRVAEAARRYFLGSPDEQVTASQEIVAALKSWLDAAKETT